MCLKDTGIANRRIGRANTLQTVGILIIRQCILLFWSSINLLPIVAKVTGIFHSALLR